MKRRKRKDTKHMALGIAIGVSSTAALLLLAWLGGRWLGREDHDDEQDAGDQP